MAEPTAPSLAPHGAEPFAPFSVMRARGEAKEGIVFTSPHSGTFYPQDMGFAAPLSVVQSTEDAAMDQLIATGPDHGAALLACHIGRAYVDLNRAPDDLDPSLIADCPPMLPGPKAEAGYGVIHRLGADRTALYDRKLSLAEVIARLERVHRPYHNALSDLLAEAHQSAGRAILVDWHSMPARATGPTGPDIILGDRHGSSCDARLTRLLRTLFEAQGWRVGLNRPYAGGYATQIWGRPFDGYHAVQIEVNRRLYWDEDAHAPSIGWKRCNTAMKRVIAEFCRAAGTLPPA